MTVRQGNRLLCWNTMARSGPGPSTARPSSRIAPDVTGRRPSTALRKVDLPQPEGPTMATSSPSNTAKSTSHRTCSDRPVRSFKRSSETPRTSSFARGVASIASPSVRRLQPLEKSFPRERIEHARVDELLRLHRGGLGLPPGDLLEHQRDAGERWLEILGIDLDVGLVRRLGIGGVLHVEEF